MSVGVAVLIVGLLGAILVALGLLVKPAPAPVVPSPRRAEVRGAARCAYCQTIRYEDALGRCIECGAPRTDEHMVLRPSGVGLPVPRFDPVPLGLMLGGVCGLAMAMHLWKR